MSTNIESIVNEVVADLTLKMHNDPTFDADVLEVIVKTVVREFIQRREYPESFSENSIADDLNKYYATILKVSEYDYNQIGIEGQVGHSENGVSRTYIDRNSLFSDVYKYVRFLV